jgi:hypothetical protein
VIGLRRDIVIVACAVSAGAHGALAPAHWAEGTGAGIGFAVSTVLLAAIGVALTLRPTSPVPAAAAAIAFAGLLVAYLLAITTGVPVLHPASEPVEGLAVTTKAFEILGLVSALKVLEVRRAARPSRPIPLALTVLVALFAGLTTLALSGAHHGHHAASSVPVRAAG